MNAEAYVDLFQQRRASAIVRANEQQLAADAVEAAIRGGFGLVEFTLTTPGALELIQDFSKRDGLCVSAGTVLTKKDAEQAVRAGARCLVSPVTDEPVIQAALELDVAAMPGAHTPNELLRAHRLGAPLQKLFPAPAGGPNFLRAVRGPLPQLRIVPTNGVDASNVQAWFAAGAFAVGLTTTLFVPADMQARRFDAIEARARQILAAAHPDA